MAKKQSQETINVNGLSAQDIINIDFETLNKFNDKNMRLIANRLVSVANKRIRRIEQYLQKDNAYTEYNPALETIEHKQFSIKGKNRNQVYGTLAEIQSFLNLKTSTMGGFKDYIKNVSKVIKDHLGYEYGSEESKDFFKLLDKVRSKYYGEIAVLNISSNELIGRLKGIYDSGLTSEKAIFERIGRYLTDKYEEIKTTEIDELDEEEIEDVFF